jgi:hypothetical protein
MISSLSDRAMLGRAGGRDKRLLAIGAIAGSDPEPASRRPRRELSWAP